MQTLNLLTHMIKYLSNEFGVFVFVNIRLTTYCHIFVKQLMTDFCLLQSHLLSQSGNNTVLLMLFLIMTGFFYPDNLIFLSVLI